MPTIATLGRQGNTRVVVVPTAGRVTDGPYRVVPHPNYVAVVAEGVALPLVNSAWLATALHGARAGLDVVVVERRSGAIDKACRDGLMRRHAVLRERRQASR